jgi:hypothetical protein
MCGMNSFTALDLCIRCKHMSMRHVKSTRRPIWKMNSKPDIATLSIQPSLWL